MRARDADATSAFGGIVGLNRPLDAGGARADDDVHRSGDGPIRRGGCPGDPSVEAEDESRDARTDRPPETVEFRSIPRRHADADSPTASSRLTSPGRAANFRRVVTKRQPTAEEWQALRFAWRVCAHVKSNAVIFTSADRTLAIGAGQMSRVDAVKVAVMKAGAALKGSVAASDAFFPFRDGLDALAAGGRVRRRAAGRLGPGRRGHRSGGRARDGDGVYRHPSLPALMTSAREAGSVLNSIRIQQSTSQ